MASSEHEGHGDTDNMDTSENPVSNSADVFRVNLERHRVFMEGRMDPDHGLVDILQETEAIDHIEVQIICAEKMTFMKNRQILDIILKGNASEKIKKLCQALKDTKQEHLLNYVKANGEYNAQFVGDWPLGKREINIIDKNVTFLKRKLDTDGGLLPEMRKHNTITQWQEEAVSEQPGRYDRSTALLEIIRRGSLSEYKNTIDRLEKTKQEHVAAILREGGAILQVHSTTSGTVPTIREGEAEIVTQLLSVGTMQTKSPKEQARLLELAQLKILGLIDSVVIESIGLFFHCKNLFDFLRLVELLETKKMQGMVDVIYNKFIPTPTKIEVTLTWNEDEFNNVRHYLEEMESIHTQSQVAPGADTTEFNIPSSEQAGPSQPRAFEARIGLLQPDIPSVEEPKYPEKITEGAALVERHIQNLLYAVIPEFIEGTGDPFYRPQLRQDEIIPSIIRNNMDYFTEHIQPRLLINKLHSLGIIRDERMRHLRSMSYDNEKNHEVLNIIRAASIENYHRFVKCLRETDQNLVADVAEKGGVVLKVKVAHEPGGNLDEVQKEIVQKLNQLQDKTVPKCEEVWRFLSQLKRANIEIVSARWDKGVVMWFWCRSQRALVALDKLNTTEFEEIGKKSSKASTSRKPEYNKFGIMLNSLFTLLLSGKGVPEISSVVLNIPDREVVCQRLSKDFPEVKDTTIDVGERTVLCAVKLENSIYVLCNNPTSALVFEEGDLTQPKEELPVEGITAPVDMASSKDSNCLYITDWRSACVWKVAVSSSEKKVDLWLKGEAGDPFTLSVTNDGRVVMVKRGPPSRVLEIYNPDARLLLQLTLPTPILIPNHAVETSKGNFLVSYGASVGFLGGVCEMTKAGQIISILDSILEPDKGVRALFAHAVVWGVIGLNYVAIDEGDYVYICSKSGIMCLDSRLNLEKVIRREHELLAPLRVQYVKQEKQLMVIDERRKNLVFILSARQGLECDLHGIHERRHLAYF